MESEMELLSFEVLPTKKEDMVVPIPEEEIKLCGNGDIGGVVSEDSGTDMDAVAVDDDDVDDDGVNNSSNSIFNNLMILPPLQKDEQEGNKQEILNDGVKNGMIVLLPPLRAEEPVASIRAALAELVQYAHFTRYKLQVETHVDIPTTTTTTDSIETSATTIPTSSTVSISDTNNKQQQRSNKKNNNNNNNNKNNTSTGSHVFSSIQYTSKLPFISGSCFTAAETKSSHIANSVVCLNDYADLTPVAELLSCSSTKSDVDAATTSSGVGFRIVLLRYDTASIQEHVARCRSLLDGNPPCVDKLVDDVLPAEKSDGSVVEQQQQQDNQNNENNNTKFKDPRLPLITVDEQFHLVDANGASSLSNFYNLACGESVDFENILSTTSSEEQQPEGPATTATTTTTTTTIIKEQPPSMPLYLTQMAQLDAQCKINWRIQYSGYHPPPSHRQMLGDLAYLEVIPSRIDEDSHDDSASIIHVTATYSGFYVNKTAFKGGKKFFNPSPLTVTEEDGSCCYSHSLLDCILQRSEPFRKAWAKALLASHKRSQLMSLCAATDTPLQSLHRLAMRTMSNPLLNNNYGNHHHHATTSSNNIESVIVRPSWIVPFSSNNNSSNSKSSTAIFDSLQEYNQNRAEDDLMDTFGLDLRAGAPRDWNEEYQVAKEMATSTLQERIDRARMIHKTLTDFGEACLLGAKAIFDGSILPMNPNEHDRSHVYLHNNIFYSRAVDAGLDTFKVYSGDAAARKSASRDASSIRAIHAAMDDTAHNGLGLYTLATVLVDYLGTRLVCQSIVPGILHGEKSHTLVYGAVETNSCLHSDEEMHRLVEESIGETFMIASRPVLVLPLNEKRMEAYASWKESITAIPALVTSSSSNSEEKKEAEKNDVVVMCGPLEVKGIQGSDQRRYLLDVTRLTPRDANWVPASEGGTGHWEKSLLLASTPTASSTSSVEQKIAVKNCKIHKFIPESLEDDDELIMAVLRRELVTLYTQEKMSEYLKAKKEKLSSTEEPQKENFNESTNNDNKPKRGEEEEELEVINKTITKASTRNEKQVVDEEDEKYFNSLRFNVNVFLPFTRSLENIDAKAYAQVMADEEHARQASNFIWETTLPSITQEMRESSGNQVPIDGIAMTDLLHSRGVNCRYLGRLAQLAIAEEDMDRQIEEKCKNVEDQKMDRHTIPLCWLELLECEMVARASKHVLDSLFTRNSGVLALQPASVVASFLSALMSTVEETAAETEARMIRQKQQKQQIMLVPPEDDEMEALVLSSTIDCHDGSAACLPSRGEIWESIEAEIGRRYRYTLTLYNNNSSSKASSKKVQNRALYTPLLRRVCQKNGIRLVARDFALGGKGVCGEGRKSLAATYPISAADILDIIPTVKHGAALVDGFVPCSFYGGIGSISLQVLLPDAKNAFEAAQLLWNVRAYARSLEYAQEASALYQRVVDTPLHMNVYRSLELISAILSHTQEFEIAISNGSHALAVAVQLGGFDSAEAVSSHSSLAYILSNCGNYPAAFKHLRAAIYLMQLLAGPRYSELANFYYRLGTLYSEMVSRRPMNFGLIALRFYKHAMETPSNDRLFEGMVARSAAMIMALLGQLKAAVESEKRAYATYRNILGIDHQITKVSDNYLQHYMKAAVEQGTRLAAENKQRQQEAEAETVADKIKAEEEEKEKIKKKKKSGKKKKK